MRTKITTILREMRSLKREVKKSNLFRKRIYTIKEAAFVAGVSYSQIQKLVASNQIPFSKPTGKLVFIRRRDLEGFLMKNYIASNDDVDTLVANQILKIKNKLL